MGRGMFVVFEVPLAGLGGAVGSAGKSLLRHLDELERLAIAAQAPSLGSFLSANPDAMAACAENEGVDLDTAQLPPEEWFSPAEGLRAVIALRAQLQKDPQLSRNTVLREELSALERVLAAAQECKVRFHLATEVL